MWERYRFLDVGAAHDPATLTAMTVASAALTAGGTIIGGQAAGAAGESQKNAMDFKAAQEEQAAQESRAAAQRVAMDKRREATLLGSKLQARAAASGGGAADPGVLDLAGDIAQRGEYEALTDMYRGENRARGFLDQAVASRLTGEAALAEGKAKRNAAFLQAAGTIIGGTGSAYKQYKNIPTREAYG